jgi:hypothetical protein
VSARASTPFRFRRVIDYAAADVDLGTPETGRNFNPEVGFLSRLGGFRKVESLVFTRWRPKSWSKFQEIRPHTNYRAYWNHDGFQETGFWHIDSSWELKSGAEFSTGFNLTREVRGSGL